MSPTSYMARLHMRADTPSSSLSTSTSIDVPIQTATGVPTIPPAIGMTPPNGTLTTLGPYTTSYAKPSPVPQHTGMSGSMKLGLGLIPVVVILVGLYILFLFWFRKNRSACQSFSKSISPPVPDKESQAYDNSFESTRRTSKVIQMSAFSIPIHNGKLRGAEVNEQRTDGNKTSGSEGTKVSMVTAPAKASHLTEADQDSPIDAGSPFRLKRGDTVKRTSLGPELARLWPSPPPSIWIKPYAANQLPLPINRRESSVYQPPPLRSTS